MRQYFTKCDNRDIIKENDKGVSMDRPKYIDWVIEESGICIKDGLPIKCYKINYSQDDSILDDWALHIRRHYVSDEALAEDVDVLGMELEDYLREYIIPQKYETLGATVRSGDIAEIIVADLLEFIKGYSVPRYKQINRSGKNNSEHGTDVIAYRFEKADKTPSRRDELIAAEVKAKLTDESYDPIENAVNHSKKDTMRLARTINHCRKKLQELGLNSESQEVTRFLLKPEYDFQVKYIAAGLSSRETVEKEIKLSVSADELCIGINREIYYIHGKELMSLAHNIYERCIK